MPQMPASSAAWSAPRPQPPATWKSTSAPCEISFVRNGLALVGRDEVLRVLHEDLRPRDGLLRAELVSRDADVDRRDLEAADGADGGRAVLLRHLRRENADETAGLVRRVGQALDVLEEALPFLFENGDVCTV